MKTAALQLVIIAAILLLLDMIWLTSTSATSRAMFAALQGSPLQIRWIPAALTYVLMTAAIWFFAVAPSADATTAAGRGALLGLAMYGIYDLTNYATLTRYTLQFALTDVAWGTFLFAVAATAATAATAWA